MRTAFFETLVQLASEDPRIFFLTGDLGFGCVNDFVERFPERYINVGVAEQDLIGIATGMAIEGKVVFVYSIANFPTLRCVEQIRNDACYHEANVKIVAVGGGMCYGSLGASHFATEDIAVLRAIPDLMVVAPGDPVETRAATRAIMQHDGPCYLRLGRAGEKVVHQQAPDFTLGKAIYCRDGSDVTLTLISTGGMLVEAMDVASILEQKGIGTRVLSMHTIKPLDTEAVLSAARETGALVTIEEHSVVGGLGGAVAEVLAEAEIGPVLFRRIGLPDAFCSQAGSQEYLKDKFGLSAKHIAATAREIVQSRGAKGSGSG